MNHTAIVTGANHGIGAAVARALANRGDAVLCTYLRIEDPEDPGTPQAYRDNRVRDGEELAARIRARGGRARAIEADLADPETPGRLFDTAEAGFGPVDILINNATGWIADSFKAAPADSDSPAAPVADRLGRNLNPVTAGTWRQQFGVDAMGAALLIAEFARRHIGRSATWGRIIGLTSGGPGGFPEEVSYGAAKAAQENYTMSASAELAPYGVTANMVYRPSPTRAGSRTPSARSWPAVPISSTSRQRRR
jgi:3-oxoacyl-[acyl-carrier protein] reductase